MGSHVVVRPLHRWNDTYELYDFVHAEREGLNRDFSGVSGLVDELIHEKTLVAVDGRRLVGIVSLARGAKASDRHVATLRIHLRPEYRGVGVGRKMMRRILFWADRNGIERIVATPYARQRWVAWAGVWRYDPEQGGRKIKFFRRFGFVDEGHMRRAARLRDGTFTDMALLARIRPPL